MTEVEAVRRYIRCHRRFANEELRGYRKLGSIEMVIEFAAWGKRPNGEWHPHQYCVAKAARRALCGKLKKREADLRAAGSFEELITIVTECTVPGIGPLTVYDAATRIGAYRRKEPKFVYLHAGTAKGAKALGWPTDRPTLTMGEVSPPFRKLLPREVEDCLCLYRHDFGKPEHQARTAPRCGSEPHPGCIGTNRPLDCHSRRRRHC